MSEPHPLFPALNEDDEAPEVGWIHVTRRESGATVACPRRFTAEELTELEQLFELFGGGTYELIARGPDRSRITARRAYILPGPSKPLFDTPPATSPATPSVTMPAAVSGGWRELLPLFIPVVVQYLQGQQTMQQAMLQNSNQLVAAMMQANQTGSREYVQSMTTLHNANMQQLAHILAAKGGGGGDGKSFMQGVEWMQEFFSGQLEASKASGDDDGTKTIEQIIEGVKVWAEMQKATAAPAAPATASGPVAP